MDQSVNPCYTLLSFLTGVFVFGGLRINGSWIGGSHDTQDDLYFKHSGKRLNCNTTKNRFLKSFTLSVGIGRLKKFHINKFDALTVHLSFSKIYFTENSAMVILCFEQGTITSAYFELGRWGLVYQTPRYISLQMMWNSRRSNQQEGKEKPCIMKLRISGTKLFSIKSSLLKHISAQKPAKQLVWTDS